MRPAQIARWLQRFYVALAIISAALAVVAILRREFGSAALNAALTVVWALLFLRLRARQLR
jgi:hypothetical protein